MTTVYVVGRATSQGTPPTWEFQGVFSTESAAVEACRDETYWTGPAELDQQLPHETMPEWPGAWFPKAGGALAPTWVSAEDMPSSDWSTNRYRKD